MTNQELSNSNFILAGFGYGVDANRDKMLNLWTNSRDRTQTRQKTHQNVLYPSGKYKYSDR